MSTVKTNNVQIGQSATATNNFTWYQPTSPDGTVRLGNGNAGAVTDRVTVTSAGNVGIGTTSPTEARLHVNGNIRAGVVASDPVNSNANIYTLNNAGGTLSSLLWRFVTNANDVSAGTERMRIDSAGNVAIANTNRNGAGKLNVLQASAVETAITGGTGYAGDVSQHAQLLYKYDNNTTTSQVFLRFAVNQNTVACGQINANGSGNVAFGGWSDRRLKENITDLPPQLESICALRPVEFDYIASEGGGHQIGFIAQEMEEVYPDVVGERSDGMLTITGWSKTEARLVKAIQEQQAIIEDLRARLAALEAK